MSDIYDHPVRLNGRTIGYVQPFSPSQGGWIWRDDTANSNGKAYDSVEEAEEALLSAYEAAVEEFGRDAHASAARV